MIIAVLNKTGGYQSRQDVLAKIVLTIDKQIKEHVCPSWNFINWECKYYSSASEIPEDAYRIWILDNSDQGSALGYHGQDPDGIPYGKVFAETIFKNGGTDYSSPISLSVVLSHEICEIVGDPEVNVWRQMSPNRSDFVVQEICDPVQGEVYTIELNNENIFVSNFVFPSWFSFRPKKGTQFDWMDKLKSPFSLGKKGSMITSLNGEIKRNFSNKGVEKEFNNETDKMHPASRANRRVQIKNKNINDNILI